jgi:hypothetical protein
MDVLADLDLHWSHMRKNAYIWRKGLTEQNCYCFISSFQGDGLEFKRQFIKVKLQMKKISSKVPPLFPLVPSQQPV